MPRLPFIEGFMPIQMLVEMGGLALLFVGSFYLLDKKMGVKVNKLAQAIGLFTFAVLYLSFAFTRLCLSARWQYTQF